MKYWYFVTTVACPICCRGKTYRERRYEEKPDDPQKRYKYIEHWDGCNV